MSTKSTENSTYFWTYLFFVIAASYFTYFHNYQSPPYAFWDEPYHVASAQKYLNSEFFMEQHPPLGKLLIALGEHLIKGNAQNSQFLDTDYANFPSSFSFAGYRLFPSLFGWLTAPLLFFIFFLINKNPKISALLSFLYIFDNALIVHSRGAMIDSTLLFFSVLMIAIFLFIIRNKDAITIVLPSFFFLGLTFGLVMTTKVLGLIMILLFIPLVVLFYKQRRQLTHGLALAFLGFFMSFCGVWYVHFSLATNVNPKLNNDGYYQASEPYKQLLAQKATGTIAAFPIMLRDSLKYVSHYNRGVPPLDMCKADENGSPFFFWPFGAKSINYRWHSSGAEVYRYLYLQVNPVVWLTGLVAVILAASMIIATLFFPLKKPFSHSLLLYTFFGMYVAYMIAISRLDRVMYLYHYFTALMFTFILFAIVLENIHAVRTYKIHAEHRAGFCTVLAVAIFISFTLYRPLTYYTPISNTALTRLAVFPLWDLHCVNCPRTYWMVQTAK